jgi:hypothetical protein
MLNLVPRKKPLSSCVPAIIENNGEFEMAIGGSGGSRILSSILQVRNNNNNKIIILFSNIYIICFLLSIIRYC